MSDRIANWGESEADARYQSGDTDPEGGDFIVVKNTDNETVLLQWDQTAAEWQFAGRVNMAGNDMTNAGLVSGVDGSFDTLEAGALSGDVVSRAEAIDNLEGNVYLESEGTDPSTVLENDGDMVFIHE